MISLLGGTPVTFFFAIIYNALILYFFLRALKFFREKIEIDKEKIKLEQANQQLLVDILKNVTKEKNT